MFRDLRNLSAGRTMEPQDLIAESATHAASSIESVELVHREKTRGYMLGRETLQIRAEGVDEAA